MRSKGGRKVAYVRYRSRTVAIEVFLSFNLAVVFISIFFDEQKTKIIQNGGEQSLRFFADSWRTVCGGGM
jgi:hypothetical protein